MIERLTAALADRYRLDSELGVGGMATVHSIVPKVLSSEPEPIATIRKAVTKVDS